MISCSDLPGTKVKVKAHTSKRPTRPELIPVFPYHEACLGVLLLPLGRDARPSEGYRPAICRRYPFVHLGEERQSGVKFLV